MRIRYKPWARQELEESKFYTDFPEQQKGKWKELFIRKDQPFYLELGCGKGSFISQLASKHSENNYLAIDVVDAMLGIAKRNIEEIYQEKNKSIDNVYLTRYDIERICNILDEKDQVERIYINFCNPWPRGKHRKKRLTHSIQLERYKTFLKKGAEIYFKTDDDNLFEDSLRYFVASGFQIIKKTQDLEKEEEFWENILTEHEQMFTQQGIKIKAVIVSQENSNYL